MSFNGFIRKRIARKVGIIMIKVDMSKLEITGFKPVLEAELVTILRNCKKIFGEKDYNHCIERAALSDEEVEKETKENFKNLVKKILGVKED